MQGNLFLYYQVCSMGKDNKQKYLNNILISNSM